MLCLVGLPAVQSFWAWCWFAGPDTALGPVFSRTRVLHQHQWQLWSCEREEIAAVSAVFPC